MNMPTVSLNVDLEDRSYPIHIGNGLCSDIALCTDELLVDGRKGVALIDEEVLKSQAEFCKKIISSIPHYKVPSGELSKSIVQLEKIWDFPAKELP